MKKTFIVEGMSCSACSASVERAVGRLDGVKEVSVDLLSKKMICDIDMSRTSVDAVILAVKKAGFTAFESIDSQTKKEDASDAGLRLLISVPILVVLMYISMGHMISLPEIAFFQGMRGSLFLALTQLVLTLAVVAVNRVFFVKGFKALFNLSPNMDTLVAIGSFSGIVYGLFAIYMIISGLISQNADIVHHYRHDLYFESSAMILTFVTFGKFLEEKAKRKTGDALRSLFELRGEKAVVERDGVEHEIPFDEIKLGDTIVLRSGNGASVDGVIISGRGTFDTSALTGESMPAEKGEGDVVLSGSVLLDSIVKIRATSVGGDTTLSRIIRAVETAGASKAPIARLADRVSRVFVPSVLCLSILTLIVWAIVGKPFEYSLARALSVLVISCPCALGLATPVAITVSVGRLAKDGILVKDASFAETASSVKTVVFDKTGTLTEGKMTVSDKISLVEECELFAIAYGLEKNSEHILSRALTEYLRDPTPVDVSEFMEVSGRGVFGNINGKKCFGGNKAFMEENSVDLTELSDFYERSTALGQTVVFFASGYKAIGAFSLSDTLKSDAIDTVSALKALGVRCVLLTGDNSRSANAVASLLGIGEVISEVLPLDKEEKVNFYKKYGKVAMVGDGINDAPSLASADVGIALSEGTDIAVGSADAVLMHKDVRGVLRFISYSRQTIRIIKQNLFWAFLYNVAAIPIAAGVFAPFGLLLNPMIGSAAMSLSSLLVVTNALRLRNK